MRRRLRGLGAALIAALLVLCLPATAQAYRRGFGTSLGGATLDVGHVLWLSGGYPMLGVGWGMAVHPLVDLMVHGELIYGSPNQVDRSIVGGGGGVRARIALLRGRTSAAITLDAAADAYVEGSGAAALIDLISPGVEISFRLGPSIALHTRMQVVLGLITRPMDLTGGFEVGAGVTVGLTRALAFIATVSTGVTLSGADEPATVRLEALVGLEYRLGHR